VYSCHALEPLVSRRVVTLVVEGRSKIIVRMILDHYSLASSTGRALLRGNFICAYKSLMIAPIGATPDRLHDDGLDRQMILITGTIARSASLLGNRRNDHRSHRPYESGGHAHGPSCEAPQGQRGHLRRPADPILFLQGRRVGACQPRRLLRVLAPHLRAVPTGLWWR
jgi:hypothetical protein